MRAESTADGCLVHGGNIPTLERLEGRGRGALAEILTSIKQVSEVPPSI